MVLFFTGTIPLSSNISQDIPLSISDERSPYAIPIISVTTAYHSVSLIYCYVQWVNQVAGQAGYLLGCLGDGFLAAVGIWCIVFGQGSGRTSRRTGADKRMTGYPFQNTAAYDKKRDRKQT